MNQVWLLSEVRNIIPKLRPITHQFIKGESDSEGVFDYFKNVPDGTLLGSVVISLFIILLEIMRENKYENKF